MYYYAIKWKSYNVEDLYISPKQKDYIENEWVKSPEQRVSQQFKLNGETYSYNSIDSITKTSKRIVDDVKLLYSAQAQLKSNAPMIDEEGNVITNWYKKLVSSREYESYYAKHPSYLTLDRGDSGIWIGFRLAVRENGEVPETVELCDEGEVERLWKYSKAQAS